jgi:hypothetical protein
VTRPAPSTGTTKVADIMHSAIPKGKPTQM